MHTLLELRAEEPGYGFTDYLRNMPDAEAAGTVRKAIRVAVLRSYTAEMLEPVLRFKLRLEGYAAEFWFGDYNGYAQEVLDAGSALYAFQPDIILLLTRLEELIPGFIDAYGSRPAAAWDEEIGSAALQLMSLAKMAGARAAAQVIVQNMILASPYWGIYDAQVPAGQAQSVARLNHVLCAEASGLANVFIWDFNQLVLARGYATFADPKLWFTARNPYRPSGYAAIGRDLCRYLLSALGYAKKCVVVDLDNTLWGGICGEDGLAGVQLGHDYPGNCYVELQRRLLRLYERGIILAVNSKNNEPDALEIIDRHPYMMLRRTHFAAVRINWEDKAANMRALAGAINIGLDSMIFIDDNPAECEFIRATLPEVATVRLPDKPYLMPAIIDTLPGIENLRLTDEDRKKGEIYKAQAERATFEQSFATLDDFLMGLGVEVAIEPANGFSLARIAQLTQKTNQMNLTTRRYMEAQVQAFMNDPRAAVFSVSSTDRFGDNGIVGVFILKFDADRCVIDTLLLSCRVIGRKIEDAMVAYMAELARGRGARILVGEYLPTAKNKPAADLYPRLGFSKVTDSLFEAELHRQPFDYPAQVKLHRGPLALQA
ncbi:MAG: HAD-IIIC family phosphatase [Gammaproteobacteria bacterium]